MSRRTLFRLLKRHWPILLPIALTVAVFHAWVQPGLILGADWVRRVPDELNSFFPWPPAWNGSQQLGETNEVYLFEFPLFAVMGLLSRLHVSWNVIERVLFLWPYLVLSVFSPYALGLRLTRSPYAAALAAAMCTVNTWVIMATERAAIPSIVAAALMPLFIMQALSFIERATLRRGFMLGVVLTILLIYDLRYVYISVVFAFVLAAEQLLRDRSFARVRRAALPLAVAVTTTLITNLFWILPQFFEPANNGSGYGTLTDYIYNSGFMTPEHALSNFAVFYHWVASNNPFLPAKPDWWFFGLPIAVFASLFFVWRRKWVWSFAVGAFISVLLDSGPSFPLDKINIWIFTHTPGFSLFRDVTKWMSLLEITYAMLIAYGAARLLAWVRLRLGRRGTAVALAAPIVAVACYTIMMSDAFNIMRFRVFATYHMKPDVIALEKFIQSRPDHDRTLVIPRDIEPMRAVLGHPYIEAMQIENSAPNDGFRHFNVHMGDLYSFFAAPYAPDLLRLMNVRYIVVPYDYDKIVYSPQISATGIYDVADFIASRPWARLIKTIGRQYVFEVRDPLETRAFVAPYPFVLDGSAAALAALAGSPLLNARLAAIIPDQPLPHIRSRIPNFVEGGWPIDTLANDSTATARLKKAAIRLDRQARSGKFPYVAAAIDTATASNTLFWDDQPLLIDTPFLWGFTGPSSYEVNTLDLRQLNRLLYQKSEFDEGVSRLSVPDSQFAYLLNTTFDVTPAGVLRYNRTVSGGYHGTIMVTNLNPEELAGDLVLTGVTTSLRNVARRLTVTFGGKSFPCTNETCIVRGIYRPGSNALALTAETSGKIVGGVSSYGAHDSATLENERAVTGRHTLAVRWIAQGLNVRMTTTPTLRLDWAGPPDSTGTSRYLVYVMRSVVDGSRLTLLDHVPKDSPDEVIPFSAWLEQILRTRFSQLLAEHSQDPGWLFANRLSREPDGYGAYTLEAIGMTVVAGNVTSDAAALSQWKPQALALHDTPEEYEIASHDARRPEHAEFPRDVIVQAPGYRVETRKPLLGMTSYRFLPAGARRRILLTATIERATTPNLDFDFHQAFSTTVKLNVYDDRDRLLFSQKIPSLQHDVSFGAGDVLADDDQSIPWPLNVPHCEPQSCGSTPGRDAYWHDVTMNIAHLTPSWGKRYKVTITVIPHRAGPVDFAIATRASQQALAEGQVPALALDGRPIAYQSRSKLAGTIYMSLRGTSTLHAGKHDLHSYPTFPIRPVSMLISHGKVRRFDEADITDPLHPVGTEFAGNIRSKGGLLVFSEAYDPRWQLAVVPRSFSPTGNALLDYFRARPYFVPAGDHYRVDDTLNGWWIPGGSRRLFMIMSLDAILQASALVWLVASASWFAFILLWTRGERTA